MPSSDRIPIAELVAGQHIDGQAFLVQQKDLRTTTTGSLYIHAVLSDPTGQLLARMWDANKQIFNSFDEGDVLRVRGRVESYRGKLQFIIESLNPLEAGAFDPSEFLPRTTYDVDVMWARVLEILGTIEDPDIAELVRAFSDDAEMAQAFRNSPAAMQLHHAYLGGLLEHTLNLLELAVLITPRYPDVNRDLVLAGLFLHDIGKTAELTYDTHIRYTDPGQLIGHIVICVQWLSERAAQISASRGTEFPADKLSMVQHIVLAHHGQYDFGSPKLPALPEAILVHLIDNIDAKLTMFRSHIDADQDQSRNFTDYIPALQTKIFKASRPASDSSSD